MRRIALLLTVLPGPLAAETPMTGAEFQAHVGNGTFSYVYSNGVRGVADYGPDRTLTWAFEGDQCIKGYWFEDGSQLCFAFMDDTLSACWHFFKDGDRLVGQATFLSSGNPLDLDIREVSHTDQPMSCPGPDVGV
jgi:hypothetical protein